MMTMVHPQNTFYLDISATATHNFKWVKIAQIV